MRFTKMHGVGNDYVYVNGLEEDLAGYDLERLAQILSTRHFGVGSDGLILILPSDNADFRMRMFNADGSEAEMCGNGLRSFAKYVYEHGLTDRFKLEVETGAGIIPLAMDVTEGQVVAVSLDMGEPRLERAQIPMLGEPTDQPVIEQPLPVGDVTINVTCVSMGNPHCVIFVDDTDSAPVT